MAGKFNSLTEYIESFKTIQGKIKAMVDIKCSDITVRVAEQDKDEYEKLFVSLIFPTDNNEDEPMHVNKEESIKRFQMLCELQGEAHKAANKEHMKWQSYVEDKYKDLKYSDEQKETITNLYHHMTSKSNNIHSTIMSEFFSLYNSSEFNNLAAQFEDGENVFEDIKMDRVDPLRAFTAMQEKVVSESGNDYTKAFMVGDTIKGKKAGSIPGLNENKEKCISQWVQYDVAANQKMPWMSKEEKAAYDLKVYGGVGVWTTDSEEIGKKMRQLSTIFNDVDKNMKSSLWDSDDYKKMRDSLKAVSEKYKEITENGNKVDSNNRAMCANLIKEAMKNASKYVSTHITNRVTTNGKNRFNAAMLIVGVANMDSATAIKDIVDNVRGNESEQKVDLRTSASKYKITLDDPFAYEWMHARDEVLKDSSAEKTSFYKLMDGRKDKKLPKVKESIFARNRALAK